MVVGLWVITSDSFVAAESRASASIRQIASRPVKMPTSAPSGPVTSTAPIRCCFHGLAGILDRRLRRQGDRLPPDDDLMHRPMLWHFMVSLLRRIGGRWAKAAPTVRKLP